MQKVTLEQCVTAFGFYLFKMFSTLPVLFLGYWIGDLKLRCHLKQTKRKKGKKKENNAQYRTEVLKKQYIHTHYLFNAGTYLTEK